ncbi:hypothetical protein I6H52_00025 [Corynebacterium urealyticum]|uniref:hypothetical protein n=1 Tax=Corynebacterium urealyticum TaxID=43771 RepID=UPI00191108F3|nr:hypothetical protein I6H52_00025 [Corynebacterium urealyticum]
MTLYDRALKLMFLLPPEPSTASSAARCRRCTCHPGQRVMEKAVRVHDPVLRQTVFGVTSPPAGAGPA